jgi:nucleoside-diphosphate-sugar epimerase
MDKKVVIVTGACGRIGAHVVKKLGEEHRVVGFELLKAIYASANEELVPVDLGSDESVHQAFTHIRHFYGSKIASVIHLAAYYSFSDQKYDNYERITVRGTERLLKALSAFEVEQLIFSSTMLVHAPCEPDQKINEGWPVKAKWAYPRSKVATEKLIHELRGTIPTVILRIAGVYDDECHSIPISNQIKRIYERQLEAHLFSGDIRSGSSFIHMDDLVEAIHLCVQKRSQLPQELVLLIGEPKTLSYDELQRDISRLLFEKEFKTISIPKLIAKIGSFVENHLPFMPKPFIKPWMIDFADDNYTLDISLAERLLGWRPHHSLARALPIMIESLKKDPKKWYQINGLK